MTQIAAVQADPQIDGEVRRDSYLLEAGLRGEHDGVAQEIAALGRGLAVFEDDPELLYARSLAYERADRIDRSEEHTSELQSLMRISYADFCSKTKKTKKTK